MKKKIYQSPQIKLVKVIAHRMLCDSYGAKSQNESYNVENEETTNGWYN